MYAWSDILRKDPEGRAGDVWLKTSIRITDLALAPDLSRLVIVGLESLPVSTSKGPVVQQDAHGNNSANSGPPVAHLKENRLIIYDYSTRTQEA